MIESPAINPISCTDLRTCLEIMVFSPKNVRAVRPILNSGAQHYKLQPKVQVGPSCALNATSVRP
jgi:hypothetical protein